MSTIQAGDRYDAFRDGPVAQQVKKGDVESVRFLLSLPGGVARDNAFHWITLDPTMLQVLLRGGADVHEIVKGVFDGPGDTRLLHRLLWMGVMESEKARKTQENGQLEDVGARLVRCVELTLEHGFDAKERDPLNQLAYHIVVDHGAVLDGSTRERLDELLAPFDGPRQPHPEFHDDDCTCGLHLGGRRRRRR